VELNAADVGWLAGPVNGSTGREMPAFTGPPSGARDPELTSRSTARAIMRSVQFSRSFKQHVIQLTQQHQQRWAAEHSGRDSTERAFDAAKLQPVHVELWFAIAVRVAKLNAAIPAQKLWDAKHHCYDAAVDAACTHAQWQWFNRHMSFGALRQADAESASNDESDSDGGSSDGSDAPDGARPDRHRSRRLVSDIARAQAPKAFRPGQHLGFDDLVCVTRHTDGKRVRHKAAVHTGRANDGLNDARSHYFLWWEELGWVQQNEERAESAVSRAVMVALLRTLILMPHERCFTSRAAAGGHQQRASWKRTRWWRSRWWSCGPWPCGRKRWPRRAQRRAQRIIRSSGGQRRCGGGGNRRI